jgi:limonene 1,2-monooxygenase
MARHAAPAPLRFGAFLAPFHADHEHPTLQIQRDFELAEHLDRLGFDEMWIGEHHSGAFETIGSPELFIAAAAERTRRIRLGTGVVSLPYHHPFMVAARILQLDHQTRGRAMLGVGPGQLASDAFMLGIDTNLQRERMHESLGVILRLLDGETVTHQSDWFELCEARLQLAPYTHPRPEVAVAGAISPTGARAAGTHGVGLLSLAATHAEGFEALPMHWSVAEEKAAEHGKRVDRARWRVVAPMHLAETREQARADVRWGILSLVRYMEMLGGTELPFGRSPEAALEQWTSGGFNILGVATVGTPDDAIARIELLLKKSGGFGTFLLMAHECASPDATRRSYELFARYVMPALNRSNRARLESLTAARANGPKLAAAIGSGIGRAIAQHEAERAATGKGTAWTAALAPPPKR